MCINSSMAKLGSKMKPLTIHQYVHRSSGRVQTESLLADHYVNWLYSTAREKAPFLFKTLISAYSSKLLGYYHFDRPGKQGKAATLKIAADLGIDLKECTHPADCFSSARHLFERQIQYWRCRPMPTDPFCVVSPSDAKVLIGSQHEKSQFFIKEKFFSFDELLGHDKPQWRNRFAQGDFAVFRLTPEKYHYNHAPVSGRVIDFYSVDGDHHSCNPGAVITAVTPFSKNKRVLTIIDTDQPCGTNIGLVAMVEVVALMIGDIGQCYSFEKYENPQPIACGMHLKKGQPKSVFRPGSSVVILFFQRNRIRFDADLIENSRRMDVASRFTEGFSKPLVETEVSVRASIARRLKALAFHN